MDLQHLILKSVLSSESYCRQVIPFLKTEYFEGESRAIFQVICDYVAKYNKLPDKSAMQVELQGSMSNVSETQQQLCYTALDDVWNSETSKQSETWLLDKTEAWCKERALTIALLESFDILTGKNKKLKKEAMPSILQDALAVSFNRSIGHDYFDNAQTRFDNLKKKEAKIPFDLAILNEITNGGAERKTLNMIMGSTNIGKTLGLCHLASGYLNDGLNVLYLTMEMAEEKIAARIDANLLDIELSQLEKFETKILLNKIQKLKAKTSGRLIIKEYPTSTPTVIHFRALIEELKIKKGFVPDVIMVDYIGIMASARVKDAGNSYAMVKAIAEELRGLAVETKTILWSATQTNREGVGNSDVTLKETAESIGLPNTVDFLMVFMQDEALDQINQYFVKQLKSRYGNKSKKSRFYVGVDKDTQRLYDVQQPQAPAAPITGHSKQKPGAKSHVEEEKEKADVPIMDDRYGDFKFE